MAKLHQLLAVLDPAQTMFKKVNEEAIATFTKKDKLFEGMTSSTVSKLSKEDELYPKFPDTSHSVPVAETVEGKLNYIFQEAIRFMDITLQIDMANCEAKGDIILDGKTVAEKVPATTLLFLENKFKSIRGVLEAVPTIDPAIVWTKEDGLYKTPPAIKPVLDIVPEHTVVAQGTDKHAPQVAVVNRTYVRGISTVYNLSGKVTVNRKSELLGKCDKIINACKQARQRANDVEHGTNVIGKSLFDYLMN